MMPAEGILRLEVLPASRLSRLAGDGQCDVLGGACFSHPALPLDAAPPGAAELPLLAVDMVLPPGEEAICEVWHTAEPLESGRHGTIRYRQGETLLFGCVSLDEAAGDARPPLQATTEAAYASIFELLEVRGYHALRFWNYFPAINQETHNKERYRQFNIGRQDAFLAHGRSVIGNVPAACALGSAGGCLHIAFLAARANVISVENPRQVSAYHYPSQYGPRSPTFSRAALVNMGGRDMLFISGTASIVGHQTLHEGDVATQTRECLQNIAAIVAEANRRAPSADFRLDGLAYKVYVRHPDDLVTVRRELAQFIGGPGSAIFLQADVCRADLLIEIEASGGHAISPYCG
jgi:chorismate lyase / 3-hydroxybenzoate synthase